MRLGLSVPITTESPQKWAECQHNLGCKSVVFPLNCNDSDSLIDEYTKQAQAYNLIIAEVGIWRSPFSPDNSRENLKYCIEQLALADRIGARCCVNVAGSSHERWDGAYRDNFSNERWKQIVSTVRTIIDEVKPTNTYFTLEPMPWMIPTGPDDYLKLLEDVDRDAFAVHMDIINMINCPKRFFFQEDFMDEVFDKLGAKIRSCHLKDIKLLSDYTFMLKECGCFEGDFNLKHYVNLASSVDPDMPMIIEHLNTNEEYITSLKSVQSRLC